MDLDKNNQPTPAEQESFARYRERMQEERMADRAPRRSWLVGVGVLFALLYIGMGVAMLLNWFKWTSSWDVPRYIVGAVLMVYGVYRGWRVANGTGYYNR